MAEEAEVEGREKERGGGDGVGDMSSTSVMRWQNIVKTIVHVTCKPVKTISGVKFNRFYELRCPVWPN